MEDATEAIDCFHGADHVYALEGTQILDAEYDREFSCGINHCHVKAAAHAYGKGRCFYLAGLKYNAENTRLLYRAMLWCAGKEELLKKAFSSNVYTECHYYPTAGKYALVNNSEKEQTTVFYDINGVEKEYRLRPNEIAWIKE